MSAWRMLNEIKQSQLPSPRLLPLPPLISSLDLLPLLIKLVHSSSQLLEAVQIFLFLLLEILFFLFKVVGLPHPLHESTEPRFLSSPKGDFLLGGDGVEDVDDEGEDGEVGGVSKGGVDAEESCEYGARESSVERLGRRS